MLTMQNPSASSSLKIPFLPSSFDYEGRFESLALLEQALETKRSFLDFCHTTFERLLEQGSKLWHFYYQCIENLGEKKGKAAFYDWLESEEFGVTKYIAKIAMDFSRWFFKLVPRIQKLVRKKALNFSAAALKELTKVPESLVEDLLAHSGRLTQASIKNAVSDFFKPEGKHLKLRKGGYAEVIIQHHQLTGQIGQLVDKPDELGNVVLALEGEAEFAFKVEDLKPVKKPRSFQKAAKASATGEPLYTQDELNQLIANAIAENQEKKVAEKNDDISRIRTAAITEASTEIESLRASVNALTQTNQNLQQQLEEKEREEKKIAELQSAQLHKENQQLQQQVQELEKLLVELNNISQTQITNQIASTTNVELEENHENLLQNQQKLEQELNEYKAAASSSIQSSALIKTENVDALAAELGTALELFKIPGWGRQGYHASNNKIYEGWDAIKAFLQEAFSSSNRSLENWGVA